MSRHPMRILPALALLGMLGAPMTPGRADAPAARKIEPAQLLAAQAEPSTAPLVVDVRTPAEFAEGHLPGAVNIPLDQLPQALIVDARLHQKPLVVYCRTGRRSTLAIALLAQHGIVDVRHLEGDYVAWTAAGHPIAKGDGPP